MTRLLLIRHGETAFNRNGRVQGHSESDLTAVGVGQARAAAEALARRRVDRLYSSDLSRARATAQIIGDRLGLGVKLDPRLREMRFGRLEGRTWTELDEHFRAAEAAGHGDWFHYAPPGGESRAELTHRGWAVTGELVRRHPDETLAVVSHGGFIGFFLRRVLGLRTDQRYVGFRTANCAIHTFEHRDDRFHLVTWGEVQHLEDHAHATPSGARLG